MNEVDILIILFIGIGIYHGIARGIITGVVDIVSLFVALAVGAIAWRIPAAILEALGLPFILAGLGGFLILTTGVSIGLTFLGLWLLRSIKLEKLVDQIGGGVLGSLFGLMLAALVLVVSGAIPNAYKPIETSAFGIRVVSLVPHTMDSLEQIGIALPKLVMLPRDYRDELKGVRKGLQFMQINFSDLDGATCMKCRGRMKFLGYKFKKGTLLSPKFQCENCGRTTDGCQSFEGFHTIYGQCPIDLANEGITFDCGVWTNGDFITPKGACPRDGKVMKKQPAQPEPALSY